MLVDSLPKFARIVSGPTRHIAALGKREMAIMLIDPTVEAHVVDKFRDGTFTFGTSAVGNLIVKVPVDEISHDSGLLAFSRRRRAPYLTRRGRYVYVGFF